MYRCIRAKKINIVYDKMYHYSQIMFDKESANELVVLINALILGKLPCFYISDSDILIKVYVNGSNFKVQIPSPDGRISEISKEQLETIISCCIDSYMSSYLCPHVDFEFDGFDLTVAFT